MSEEEGSSKRARTDSGEEDQWKFALRDWLLAAPRRRSLRIQQGHHDNDDVDEILEVQQHRDTIHRMILRLLELPSQDPAGNEAFAALMENAAYCFNERSRFKDITLGFQTDYKYSELTENSMPYLKEFLTHLPKSFKSLDLRIGAPEIFRTFPEQIGNEGSALEYIFIRRVGYSPDSDREHREFLSLGNLLSVTRNFKEVNLQDLYAHTPSENCSRAFLQSKTKRIKLCNTIIRDQSTVFLHPDTTLPFECIDVRGPNIPSWLYENGLEYSKMLWRQLLHASKHTLSDIIIARPENKHFLAAMCIEVADQDLRNIKTIKLSEISTDLLQPLSRLARSQVGETLKRLKLTDIKARFLPPRIAPTIASFQNLEDLVITYKRFNRGKSDIFLTDYLNLAPQSLRKIELNRIELSATSFRALFSNKTLESIKLFACGERDFFFTCENSFSSKLHSLDIWAGQAYDTEQILGLLSVLPNLRRLTIDGVEIMEPQDAQRIASGISKHQKLCFFECFESKRSLRCRKDGRPREDEKPTREKSPSSWSNGVLRLACLLNRFNASERQLPLGFIPIVIMRSEEVCGESGMFQFLKEKFPSYLGS